MKTKYPDPVYDPTIFDEPEEEIFDNVFLQVQFIHPRGLDVQYPEG